MSENNPGNIKMQTRKHVIRYSCASLALMEDGKKRLLAPSKSRGKYSPTTTKTVCKSINTKRENG